MAFWSVAQTENQRETTAQLWLHRSGFETYLPKIKTVPQVRDRAGLARTVSRIEPLFRSYLFVRIIDRWSPVNGTIGIIGLLLAGEKPVVLPEGELIKIKKQEHGGLIRLPTPKTMQLGDKVRIINRNDHFRNQIGVFQGMSGRERVEILLGLLGRQVRVLLPRTDVALVDVA